jgi:branched-chain amino acid transport system substrate-binding protein
MSDPIKNQDGLTRRELVFSAGAGVVGLAIGGGVVGAITAGGGDEGGGDTGGDGGSTKPIVLGGAFPLTGVSAGDGVEAKRAIEMAATDLNEAGGVLGRKVETVCLDIESDLAPDKIRNVLQRLVNEENVSFVSMVFCDYTNGSWDPVVTKGVPLMHVNASTINTSWVEEDIAKRGMIFEACPNETWYAPNLIGLLDRLQEADKWTPTKKSAAIVTSTDPYSDLIAKQLQEGLKGKGWEIPVFEKVTAPLSEWGPVLAKVREASPGLVVNTDWLATDLAAFTKQFMGSPTPSLVYEQFGPSTPEYLELAGDAANGVLWSTTIGVLPDKMGDDFRARFEEEYGVAMGFSTGGAIYDQTMTWANAAAMAGDADDFAAVVEQLKMIIRRGIVGTLDFNPKDNQAISYPPAVSDPSLGMPLLSFQIQDGQQICIDPFPYATGEFILPPQLQ